MFKSFDGVWGLRYRVIFIFINILLLALEQIRNNTWCRPGQLYIPVSWMENQMSALTQEQRIWSGKMVERKTLCKLYVNNDNIVLRMKLWLEDKSNCSMNVRKSAWLWRHAFVSWSSLRNQRSTPAGTPLRLPICHSLEGLTSCLQNGQTQIFRSFISPIYRDLI